MLLGNHKLEAVKTTSLYYEVVKKSIAINFLERYTILVDNT